MCTTHKVTTTIKMKSTKVQNPRRIPRMKSIIRGLATPRGVAGSGQFSLLRGASCIGITLSLAHG